MKSTSKNGICLHTNIILLPSRSIIIAYLQKYKYRVILEKYLKFQLSRIIMFYKISERGGTHGAFLESLHASTVIGLN